MKFYIGEYALDVNRHVNPDGSLGGFVCLNAHVDPTEQVDVDEIVISNLEYTTSIINKLIDCNHIRRITLQAKHRLTVY